MEALSLPKSPFNIQKCLLPACQFLKKNYGRICLINSYDLDFQCIVKVGMCESIINKNDVFYVDCSAVINSSKRLFERKSLNKISIKNFKVLKKPLIAKTVDIEAVFYDIFEIEKYKNNKTTLERIIRNILKFYVVCNKCTIFLDNIEMHQKVFIKCLIITCTENINDYQPYEINSNTKIKIKNCISELKLIYSEMNNNNNNVEIGGYHKTFKILEDIIKFSFVNSCNDKFVNKLLLSGPQGCGKSSLVRHVSYKNRCLLLEIKACEINSLEAEKMEIVLQDTFKKAQIYAKYNECCVILITNIDMICGKNSYSKKFTQTLFTLVKEIKKKKKIFIIATSNSLNDINFQIKKAGMFEDELEMTYPNATEREEIIYLILKKYNISTNKNCLTQVSKWSAGFVGSELNKLVIETLKLYYKNQGFQSSLDWNAFHDCFKQVFKKVIPDVLKDTISLNRQNELKFSSLGGLENVKKILDLAVIKQLQNFKKFDKLGISFTNGILLYGPSGCAKTSLVKALAKECNIKFFVTSAADLYSPYVGDTEKKLVKLFNQAKMSSPSIIFIDEIDLVIGSKSGDREKGIQERILSTLLLEMDGISSKILAYGKKPLHFLEENKYNFKNKNLQKEEMNYGVIILGATNRPHQLDEALLRPGRFDKLIYLPPPDETERFKILKKLTEKMPLHESVDLKSLSKFTTFYTGADLKNLCQESGLYALQSCGMEVEFVHQFHFEQAIFGFKPSLNEKIVYYYKLFQKNNKPC